jgi:hypothetical protein
VEGLDVEHAREPTASRILAEFEASNTSRRPSCGLELVKKPRVLSPVLSLAAKRCRFAARFEAR